MRKLNLLSSLLLLIVVPFDLYVFIDTLKQSTGEIVNLPEGGYEIVYNSVFSSPMFFPNVAMCIIIVAAAASALLAIIIKKPVFSYIQIAMAVGLAVIYLIFVQNPNYYLGYFMSVRFGFSGILDSTDKIDTVMYVLYLGSPILSAVLSAFTTITEAVKNKKSAMCAINEETNIETEKEA